MTPQERAKKIWNEIPRDLGADRWMQFIAAQIEAAQREAIKDRDDHLPIISGTSHPRRQSTDIETKRKPTNCLRCGHQKDQHNDYGYCFGSDPTEIETKCVCTWIQETWNAARDKALEIARPKVIGGDMRDHKIREIIAQRIGDMEP